MLGKTMTQAEYRAHSAISKSDLFKITKSPMHFKYALDHPEEQTPALVFGSACHKYILEKEDFGKEFAVVPNIDRRTKAGKEAYAKFVEESEGKSVISQEDMDKITEMAESIKSNSVASRLLQGEHERSFFWIDEDTGVECKCRPDCITRVGEQFVLVDLKTTMNAETEAFKKNAISLGYDLQCALYSEGIEKNIGVKPAFVFVAIEKTPPYAVNVLQADEFMMQEGKELFHGLLEIYKECKDTDDWYGYMGKEQGIQNLGLPNWLQKLYE